MYSQFTSEQCVCHDKNNPKAFPNLERSAMMMRRNVGSSEVAPPVHVFFTRTSWPVALVWALLSFLVALTSLISFVQPEWFVREATDEKRPFLTYDPENLLYMIGLNGVCYKDGGLPERTALATGDNGVVVCFNFGGGTFDFTGFPAFPWQGACFLFGCGCFLFGTCALFAFLSLGLLEEPRRSTAIHRIGCAQTAAVILQGAALILYPLVLASHFAQAHCGTHAFAYCLGSCRVGWAFVLAIICTVLGFYCPLLVKFTSYEVCRPCYWTNYV